MTAKINLINPEDALPAARRLLAQSGKHPLVAAWIETAVVKWLRRDPTSATLVPPGSKDTPAWAAEILERGEAVHRFALSPFARDFLAHIEDFLAEAVKASKKESDPLHVSATRALRGLTKTSIEQAHGAANLWFTQVARQDDDDTATLKVFKGRRELDAGDGLSWFLALPTDLRRIAGQLENCLGRKHYAKDVREGRIEIWALRGMDDRILAAAHIDVQSRSMVEAKEKNNQLPNAYAGHVAKLAAERKVSNAAGAVAASYLDRQLARYRDAQAVVEVGSWKIVLDTQEYSKPYVAVHASAPKAVKIATTELKTSAAGMKARTEVRPATAMHYLCGIPDVQELETCMLRFWGEFFLTEYRAGKLGFGAIVNTRQEKVLHAGPVTFLLDGRGTLSGQPVSWRNRIGTTEKIGKSRIHDLLDKDRENDGLLVEWGDHLSRISRNQQKAILEADSHLPACPDAEAIVRHLDPKAQHFKATIAENLEFKEPPVAGLDLWPTGRGWVGSDELWIPMEAHPDLVVTDVRGKIGHFGISKEVAAIRTDKTIRPFAALRQDDGLHIDMPGERSLARLDAMNDVIRDMAERASGNRCHIRLGGDAPRWLRVLGENGKPVPSALPDQLQTVGFSGFSRVSESGRMIWSDDQGCVYRLKDFPTGLIGVRDDTIVWMSGLPKSGMVNSGAIYTADGIGHITRFLMSAGLRLGPAFLDQVKKHGCNLANGIPVARGNTHLDSLKAGDRHRWKRVLSEEKAEAMPGEDRFWILQEVHLWNNAVQKWRNTVIALTATAHRREGRTMAALEGDSAVAAIRNNPALVGSLVTLLNESRMTLPAPILAAIGIRIEGGKVAADVADLSGTQANLVEHGALSLRWTPGAETTWAIMKSGAPDGAPLGVVTVSPQGTWAMRCDVQLDDLQGFMIDLTEAMRRLEQLPMLGRAEIESEPEQLRLVGRA